jgi:hypothetical protein
MTLMERAAQAIVEFGLEHASMTAEQVRARGRTGRIVVEWYPLGPRCVLQAIELAVSTPASSRPVMVSMEALGLAPADARRVHELYGRIVALAEQLHALR